MLLAPSISLLCDALRAACFPFSVRFFPAVHAQPTTSHIRFVGSIARIHVVITFDELERSYEFVMRDSNIRSTLCEFFKDALV
jgi:hypothetical protein